MKRLAFVLALLASPATAQQAICADRDVVLDTLRDRFGETRQSWGLSSGGQIVEVFASDETGGWSITITAPDGITCLVMAGQRFEVIPSGEPL